MAQSPVAVVTGAGSGIGRATAAGLAAEGYTIVLVGRTQARLHETAALIEEQMDNPPRLLAQSVDVTQPKAVEELIDGVVESFGRIDALVNVAGYAALATLAETTPERWRKTIDVNLSAVMYLTQAAWPYLAKSDRAMVVNVSSMASKDPFPRLGAYAAAKIGVNMLTQVAAKEGAAEGIRAVCIAPGAVETPMLRSLFDEQAVPAAAAMAPQEVAKAITDCIVGHRAFEAGETIFLTK